ncbi:hypothetical protein [Actinomadura meridiana]
MATAVVSASVTVAVTVCGGVGGAAAADGTGTAAKASASASAKPDSHGASLSPDDARAKFVKCLRDNGVDVPDRDEAMPRWFDKGVNTENLKGAMEKCRSQLMTGSKLPDLNDPKARARLDGFARCMREHGVKLPDLYPNGRFKAPGPILDPHAARTAVEQCRTHLVSLPGSGN